jgi:hypothetical protein
MSSTAAIMIGIAVAVAARAPATAVLRVAADDVGGHCTARANAWTPVSICDSLRLASPSIKPGGAEADSAYYGVRGSARTRVIAAGATTPLAVAAKQNSWSLLHRQFTDRE